MKNTSEKARQFAAAYQPLHGLPPLAGLGSFPQAVEPGLSVEESVTRLKRHHYAFRRLHHLWIARLTAEPVYELKMAFSYHAYLAAEAVTLLRNRVGEMREPPLGLDKIPHPALERFFDELLAAEDTALLLTGVYSVALPSLKQSLERHWKETHLLADQPTRRLLATLLPDLEEMLDYGAKAVAAMAAQKPNAGHEEWLARLGRILRCAGGMDGLDETATGETLPSPSFKPHVFNGVPKRDERFPDPYNMGVNAEVFLYDPAMPAEAKVLMMFYKRLREIDVPEMMASIITETTGKPWNYYRDLTRQLWDEARHAMMGEVGFVSVGVDWPRKVMVNFTWSLGLNTQLTPKERHAVLYFIEQGLMPKSGKRHEWEVGVMSQNPLAATFQDFDWADEVLHARVGRDWYVADMPSAHEAVSYGDACWSKVLSGWETWRNEGLTAHANWWPQTYLEFCERNCLPADPAIASFATTYQATRADLKQLPASG